MKNFQKRGKQQVKKLRHLDCAIKRCTYGTVGQHKSSATQKLCIIILKIIYWELKKNCTMVGHHKNAVTPESWKYMHTVL